MAAEPWLGPLLEILDREANRGRWAATGSPLKVFLSYASPDLEFVRHFASLLKDWGHDVWFDKESLVAGAPWELQIEEAVRDADLVVVVVSGRSVHRRGYAQKEMRLAVDASQERPEGAIFLMPFRLDDAKLPPSLREWHALDARSGDAYRGLQIALSRAAQQKQDALAEAPDSGPDSPSGQEEVEQRAYKKVFGALERELKPERTGLRILIQRVGTWFRSWWFGGLPRSWRNLGLKLVPGRGVRWRPRATVTTAAVVLLALFVALLVVVFNQGEARSTFSPTAVAVGEDGTVYVSEHDEARVSRMTGTRRASFAGVGTPGLSGDGGLAVEARMSGPSGLAGDGEGGLYIADTGNSRVRMVSRDGRITTVPGTAPSGTSRLGQPYGVAIGRDGLYVLDAATHTVYEVRGGTLTAVAGVGRAGFGGDSGPATRAALAFPRGIAASNGFLYIADTNNHRIRDIRGDIIGTLAGTGVAGFSGDGGDPRSASLSYPQGVAVAADGTVYVADTGNHRVRRILDGRITTYAGTGTRGFAGDGGPATAALLAEPTSVAVGADGTVYVVDAGNGKVRRIGPDGTISSLR